jgi:hypothetical protein
MEFIRLNQEQSLALRFLGPSEPLVFSCPSADISKGQVFGDEANDQ